MPGIAKDCIAPNCWVLGDQSGGQETKLPGTWGSGGQEAELLGTWRAGDEVWSKGGGKSDLKGRDDEQRERLILRYQQRERGIEVQIFNFSSQSMHSN